MAHRFENKKDFGIFEEFLEQVKCDLDVGSEGGSPEQIRNDFFKQSPHYRRLILKSYNRIKRELRNRVVG